MVVQRLVSAERKLRLQAEALAAEKAEEAERLKGELTVLQVRWNVELLTTVHACLHVCYWPTELLFPVVTFGCAIYLGLS